jgi:glutamate-1-semialdehyde 2,1-aminomutase
MRDLDRSRALFEGAKRVVPGGVNSPVRAFGAVGGTPVFMASGQGSIITDEDGNDYNDYVGSWGPMILGHRYPAVIEALDAALALGTSFGTPTRGEVDLAELVAELVPSVEVSRLVSSGTEATMSAVRLARAFTGRDKVIKFRGGYHGHADSFLVAAGSGAATLGVPSSPGVTEGTARDTLLADFNDAESVAVLLRSHRDDVACVIVEPVAGNMGCVPPDAGFLESLRDLTTAAGTLLVFDEVMTGFRVALGGAQEHFGVTPDLTTLGKVIGGGLPVGAYGGAEEIMRQVAPDGPMYQAGTLSGNPLATAAGLATLRALAADPGLYDELESLGRRLDAGFAAIIADTGLPLCWQRVGAMGTLFFRRDRVRNWEDADSCDTERFGAFFRGMLERGHYLPPSAYEALFLSAAHSHEQLDALLADAADVLGEVFA